MRLKILKPTAILIDQEIRQMTAESSSGKFCLKPRHIDYFTVLVPGILHYLDSDGDEHFVAVDGGILVKQSEMVEVASRQAISGELGALKDVVRKMHADYLEREKNNRSAAARLEIGLIKRFFELGLK